MVMRKTPATDYMAKRSATQMVMRKTPATDYMAKKNATRDWEGVKPDFILRYIELEQKTRLNDLIEAYLIAERLIHTPRR